MRFQVAGNKRDGNWFVHAGFGCVHTKSGDATRPCRPVVQQGEPRLLNITGPVVSQHVVWFPVFMCAGTAAAKKLSLVESEFKKNKRRSARFGASTLTELRQLNFSLESAKLKFSDMVSEVLRLVVKRPTTVAQ